MVLDRCRFCNMNNKDCDGAVPACSECSDLTATNVTCTYSQPMGKPRDSPSTNTFNSCIRTRSSCDGAYPRFHQRPTEADCVYPKAKPAGAHADCRNCTEDGLQCDRGFPACQSCKTYGKSESCDYFFKGLPLRALLRQSIPALLHHRELRDPNGHLAPRSCSYKDLVLDRNIPNATHPKSKASWLQPGDGCTPAGEDVAAQFQRFLQPEGFFDFNTDADDSTRHLCVKQCGDISEIFGDPIDHCYPGPDTTIATCRLRFHPACSSSVQFGATRH
jgi:hypothetical protein